MDVQCTLYNVQCTWGGVYTYDVYMGLYMCGNVTTRHDIPCFNRMVHYPFIIISVMLDMEVKVQTK